MLSAEDWKDLPSPGRRGTLHWAWLPGVLGGPHSGTFGSESTSVKPMHAWSVVLREQVQVGTSERGGINLEEAGTDEARVERWRDKWSLI